MRPTSLVGTVLMALVAAACGGGGGGVPAAPSSPPASPAAPTPAPTSSSAPVYASNDNRVDWAPDFPEAAVTPVQGGYIGVGWKDNEYGLVGTGTALKFDLGALTAGRAIKKATFRLYAATFPREFTVRPQIRVNAFASGWDPAVLTWNIWVTLECHATGEAQVPAPSALGALDFDVTTIVQNWVSGSWSNHGLRLMVNQPDAATVPRLATTWFQSLEVYEIATERPQLIVEYQ